jgi:hypothetical protein
MRGVPVSAAVLPILREAFSQRPDWRDYSPRQLSILLYLYGYTPTPEEELEIAAALPSALEDLEGAA